MANLTAIVIAKDEEAMIVNCLETLRWCDQVLVMDNGSQDRTAQLAEKWGAKVIAYQSENFAKLREAALKYVKTDWVFYVDADERVSPQLAQEIEQAISQKEPCSFKISRHNICYGYYLQYGGYGDDWVTRVFHKKVLQGWQGEIHESPVLKGKTESLQQQLWHLTHRSTQDNLFKSAEWTIKEASLLAAANTAQVSFWLLIRKGMMEFVRRAVFKQGYKDGLPGLIEALVQGINRVLVYIQVWELQQKPSLRQRYQQQEEKIATKWQK